VKEKMPGGIADCRRIFLVSVLDLRIRRGNVREVGGSHRMDGEVILGQNRTKPVHLVTVRRSGITRPDLADSGLESGTPCGSKLWFSLTSSPEALFEAARRSAGEHVEVEGPIQLIVYGVPEAE